jgi:hypothetical protein
MTHDDRFPGKAEGDRSVGRDPADDSIHLSLESDGRIG